MASREIDGGLYLHDLRNADPVGFCNWVREASVFWETNAQGLSMSLDRHAPGLWTEMQRAERQALNRGRAAGDAMLMRMAELSEESPIPVQAIADQLSQRGQGALLRGLRQILPPRDPVPAPASACAQAAAAPPAQPNRARPTLPTGAPLVQSGDWTALRTPTVAPRPLVPPPPSYEVATADMELASSGSRAATPMAETKGASVYVDPSAMLQHLDSSKFAAWLIGGSVFLDGVTPETQQPRWKEFVEALIAMAALPDRNVYHAAEGAAHMALRNGGSGADAVCWKLRDSHKFSVRQCVTVLQQLGGHELARTLAEIPHKW